MHEEVIFAGFGGQGVLLMGQLVTYAGMMEGRNVTWMPSYGPEMRGGTANCGVVVSEREIASPLVNEPTSVVAMNRPSLEKFQGMVRPGGLVIYNSSLVDTRPSRSDVRVLAVPANEIANEIGDMRVANMVALGAYLAATGVVSVETVLAAMKKVLPERRHGLIPLNEQAIARGRDLAAASGRVG
ncbi:MAG: 2-oxoacid:acceptor oxidoreductase family protein [Firmicutes bacterium]|jgi:2-oxoglutarate ferredoxin oxidoreductase subunit gamma|nr:2-oxoacid:acceptor oxidoreductase family protein [Bacillota bacterium]MDH7495522.1 2-oxoacid:acceptor oxidoreductase family protein [Bacillota bacterium]